MMAELYGVCERCGERVILGDAENIGVEMAPGIEVQASIIPEVMEGLRKWLEDQPCPTCGGPLRVPESTN
jgi:hypothetical protein